MPSSPEGHPPLWLPLADPRATSVALTGGKGASLARMAAAGLPVPDAFVLTTAAYGRDIAEPDVAAAIQAGCASLGPEPGALAVRSSATVEDLPGASFAGQQDTVLNVHGEAEVVAAIRRCWASLYNARAVAYRAAQGIDSEAISLAVVVQRMVAADAAGVLFTVDPVSGDAEHMTINATWGLGESLVGGQVTPDTLIVDRRTGEIVQQTVGDKTIMTTARGQVAVPPERRREAVLSREQARALARFGQRIDALYGQPMDVEWALADGRIAILQARPITTLATDAWNDSLRGDFLWTSANLGEAVPDVMTPATWSLVQRFIYGAMQANFTAGYSPVGNIGGRLYMNLSLTATQASVLFMSRKTLVGLLEQAFGRIPDDVDIPRIPISRWRVLRELIPAAVRLQLRVRRNTRRFDAFIRAAPGRVDAILRRVAAITTRDDLRHLWYAELGPLLDDASAMLEAATRRDSGAFLRVRRDLSTRVGQADADLLLSGSTAGASLASLEPLLGLEQVAHGGLTREAYAQQYGHRGPHEFEVSLPRPAEDPRWIDGLLDGLRTAPTDASALLARRRAAAAAAWDRLAQREPRKLPSRRKQVATVAQALRAREAARSEVVRVFWPLRTFYLRAGELLGRGDDVFFVSIDELLRVLGGDTAPLASVTRRRAMYRGYAALPPYPVLIRGHFDPFAWAASRAEPTRRPSDTLTGFPGAPGVVEGTARVLASPEDSEALRPGEILVTPVTNVGWTPIFPRAAAIVTDVGAPLSHAAIVARELGIPAVVGTTSATQRIRTGDWLRVDGSRGTVERLKANGADA